MKIEITIPVLNEEETLLENVRKTLSFLETSIIDEYSIVIADNGSTDKTRELGKKLANENIEVSYLNVGEKGVGRALKASWKDSNADIVGYMDLDLATDLNHLEEVYEVFKGEENIGVINGSRLHKNSVVKNRKFIREVTSRSFNLIAKFLLGYKISDGMCGFKFFRSDIAKELIKTGIETNGWIFSTEMLAKASWKKINIKEIAVKWEDDGSSKVKIISLSKEYFKHLIKLNQEKNKWVRDFGEEE